MVAAVPLQAAPVPMAAAVAIGKPMYDDHWEVALPDISARERDLCACNAMQCNGNMNVIYYVRTIY